MLIHGHVRVDLGSIIKILDCSRVISEGFSPEMFATIALRLYVR